MNEALQQLLFFALLIGGFYLLAIRPQRVRAKALQQVRAGLEAGSRVITTAGIHATVVVVEGDDVVLEIAPGVRVRFASAAVVRVLTPEVEQDEQDLVDDEPEARDR
ncbi:MAG: putative preprotein translocase subunit YajC [Frankiales bacterium]|nr:putative preprotein translocase subunit YajC [Frankiales bacterium]